VANAEQLAILKQGVEVWNRWREKNPDVEIDLKSANLSDADLIRANLRGADLRGTNLFDSNLGGAFLTQANLSGAHLDGANLRGAALTGANLRAAHLDRTNLSEAILTGADLGHAFLRGTIVWGAHLSDSNWSDAVVGSASFGDSDLSQVIGLELIIHNSPSSISIDALMLSRGQISEKFLRGCGLSDWEIESVKLYNPGLTNEERSRILYRIYDFQASQAIQISPLFISYSHSDSIFVDKIGKHLQDKGIRYWRDIHEMKAGKIETQIDRGIRQNPTVLLILSEASLNSDWVQHEVRTARDLEKALERDVLCPVALDDGWKNSRWPQRIMEQIMEYNILDFSAWKDDSKFEGTFRRLIDGLELFYKG
jgi:hypothetical protein